MLYLKYIRDGELDTMDDIKQVQARLQIMKPQINDKKLNGIAVIKTDILRHK